MPIKIPKGFSRRKSSTNALEEVENPPEPSFRVFERPQGGSKSFDGVSKLNRLSSGRPLSSPGNQFKVPGLEDESGNTTLGNRGSGGTDHSTSTGGYYDNSSSSARFSSSSTLPSSTEVSTTDESNLSRKQDTHHGVPIPTAPESRPAAFSLRAAGRTFSFGTKGSKSSIVPVTSTTQLQTSRSGSDAAPARAITTNSYASTATAPKLETEVALGGSELGSFGDMFKSFGKRRSTAVEEPAGFFTGMPRVPSPDEIPPAVPPKSYHTPSPIHVGRSHEIDSSPYSWDSPHSNAGLIPSPSPELTSGSNVPSSPSPVLRPGSIRPLTPSNSTPLPNNYAPSESNISASAGFRGEDRRGYGPVSRVAPASFEDEDAKLVMDSVNASRALNRQAPGQGRGLGGLLEKVRDRDDRQDRSLLLGSSDKSPNSPSAWPTESSVRAAAHTQLASKSGQRSPVALFDNQGPEAEDTTAKWRDVSNDTTPRAKKSVPVHDRNTSIDSSIAAAADLAARFEERASAPVHQAQAQNKVMTPAQYERYRQQRELSRTKSDASKSEDSEEEDDLFDDEDEAERARELAKQRRKQEAHLSVYRQQMMKVTGDQPTRLPGLERTNTSSMNLGIGLSTMSLSDDKPSEVAKTSDEDEDEDVPLGILAAHGFPNKNRPPAQLANGHLSPNLRSASQLGSYPPPPGSIAGDSAVGGSRSSVPVFARNLPQDPYFGASLVNPANREPLAFSHNGGSSARGGAQPSLPPGGLVGVIAGEERARAMRRGSPNAQGSYGPLGPNIPPMAQQMPGMGTHGIHGVPPMMTPGDHAQMQMSHQMSQMMQMQMQFMQQMMQIQGAQNNPAMPQQSQQHQMMNSYLAPPGQMPRPYSLGSQSAPTTPGQPPQLNPRAMSMLDPASAQWHHQGSINPGYAASGHLQVSNNQGYASSIAPSERSNVGMPPRYRPVSTSPVTGGHNAPGRSPTTMSGGLQDWSDKQGSQTTVRAVNTKKAGGAGSDDDDDEGWEQMKQKREMKKSTWKTKKGNNGFEDVMWTQNSVLRD